MNNEREARQPQVSILKVIGLSQMGFKLTTWEAHSYRFGHFSSGEVGARLVDINYSSSRHQQQVITDKHGDYLYELRGDHPIMISHIPISRLAATRRTSILKKTVILVGYIVCLLLFWQHLRAGRVLICDSAH